MADREANVVLTANTSQYSQQMTAAQSSTNSTTDSVLKLLDALNRLTKNTGRKIELLGAGGLAGITAAAVAAGRFESQLGTLQATAAITGRSMGNVSRGITDVTRTLPVSTGQVIQLSTALTKLGADPRNLEKLATTFVKLSAATGEDMTALAQGLTQLQRAMGTGSGSTEKFANSIAGISANMGVSATATLQFAQSIAPIGRTVGMTQNEVTGLSAALVKSGQDGYSAANAITKMLSDINDATRYGSPQLTAYANVIGKTVEEFKSMSAIEQASALVDAFSKSGAEGAKTMERLGLEGVRTQRAFQALSQGGGIQGAVDQANAQFNGGALNKGSEKAMDGLNDQLTKLRNNLSSMARDFGSSFLPIVTGLVKGLNGMASAGAEIVRALSPIAGILAAIASVGTMGIGGLVSNFGLLATAAAGVMLARSSLGAGFARGRQNQTGQEPRSGIYRNSIRSFENGAGGPVQRRMYAAGQQIARPVNWLRDQQDARRAASTAAGPARGGLVARAAMLGSVALQAPIGFLRSQVDPIRWQASRDLTRRANPASFVRDARSQVRAGLTGEGASVGRAFSGLAGSTTRFVGALASATAGLTRMTAAAAVSTAQRGLGAAASNIGAAGRGLLGAVGGLPGLAIGGALAGGYAIADARAQGRDFKDRLKSEEGMDAAVNQYAAALGIAQTATMTFAEALNKASGAMPVDTVERATAVTAGDTTIATTAGREYTVAGIGEMERSQATAYAGTMLSAEKPNPQAIQALKLDLIQRYGPEAASDILKSAGEDGFSFGSIIATERSSFTDPLDMRTSDTTRDSIAAAVDSSKVALNSIAGQGPEEAAKLQSATVNQLLDAYAKNNGKTDAQTSILQGIEEVVGGNLKFTDNDQINLSRAAQDSPEAATREFRELIAGTEAGDRFLSNTRGIDDINTRRYMPNTDGAPMTELERRTIGSYAGAFATGNAAVQDAVVNEGDANKTAIAVNTLRDEMIKATGSTAGANKELQRLKAAINDPTDQMYKLATAAQGAVDKLAALEAVQMTAGQRAGVTRTNLANAATADPNSQDYQANLSQAGDDYNAARTDAYTTFKQVVTSFREFNIQQDRSTADFAKNRARQDTAYNLSRKQSNEDYALSTKRSADAFEKSRARGEAAFELSRKQTQQDYDLGVSRGLEDYNKGRMRAQVSYDLSVARSNEDNTLSLQRQDEDYQLSRARSDEDFMRQKERTEADYQRSLMRGQRDYDLSRKQSQDDFNLSRLRSEADYQHQVELMTEQTAKSISDIYQRQATQRTWSAASLLQNAGDQQRRMAQQQQDLAKIRGMGVSSDVIKQLGLNDFSNQQQLARMVSDLAKNPELVNSWNESIKGRLDLGKAFVEDEDNTAFTEMERQFKLTADRAIEDFERMATRGQEAYEKSLKDMSEDYTRQTQQGEDDYARMTARQGDDYQKMSERAASDYAKMMKRTADDFATSTNQQAEDWNTMTERSSKDYATATTRNSDQYQLMTQQASEDYTLMTEQTAADYEKMLKRQNAAYKLSIEQTVTDWNTSMTRAKDDLNRSFEEVTGTFGELQESANKLLSGAAAEQMAELSKNLGATKDEVVKQSQEAADGINKALTTVFSKDWFADTGRSGGGGTFGVTGKRSGDSTGGTAENAPMTVSSTPVAQKAADAPVMGDYRLSSRFGNRSDPFTGQTKYHSGDDYAAKSGTGVRTPRNGKVIFAGSTTGGFGNLIKVDHGDNLQSWYGHLSNIGVEVGQQVSAGSRIGAVGNTGRSTGPHLHFQVMQGGKAIDPMSILAAGSTAGGGTGATPSGTAGTPGTLKYQQAYDLIEKTVQGNAAAGQTDNLLAALTANPRPGGISQEMTDRAYVTYQNRTEQEKAAKSKQDDDADNDYTAILTNLDEVRAIRNGTMPTIGTATGTNNDAVTPGAGAINPTGNRLLGQQMAAARGWTGNQWNALEKLWTGESGWRNTAQNPTSTAYGIAQFLNSTWATVGGTKTSDPGKQIEYGMKYIADRYTNPTGALSKWQNRSPHWYGEGGLFSGQQVIGVGEKGPEAVLPLNERGADFLAATMARFSSGNAEKINVSKGVPVQASQVTYNQQYNSGIDVSGPITVQSADPNEMARKLEAKARLGRLSQPGRK